MIPGIRMTLGGTEYIVPPLSLGAVELLSERLDSFTGKLADAPVVVDALFAALKRNYPDITRPQVAELVDVGSMLDVIEAVMDVGGMKRKGLEAGEKPAA